MKDLKVGHLYKVDGRNFQRAVWTGKVFIGVRHKFYSTFLDSEYCRGDPEVPGFDTALPLEEVGPVPEGIPLNTDSKELFAWLRKTY